MQYSGGQATEGQGGYYGSGGARHNMDQTYLGDESRRVVLALAADVEKIRNTMEELESLEALLLAESGDQVTPKQMELKNAIKKLMTAKEFVESLNRLEVEDKPVWGLSTEEREMVVTARDKVNEC
jgi:hypothetical protein